MSPPSQTSATTTVPFEQPQSPTATASYNAPVRPIEVSDTTGTTTSTVPTPETITPKKRAIIGEGIKTESGPEADEQRHDAFPMLEHRSRETSLEVAFHYAWSETYNAVKKEALDTKASQVMPL
jgi:hypothetical protein